MHRALRTTTALLCVGLLLGCERESSSATGTASAEAQPQAASGSATSDLGASLGASASARANPQPPRQPSEPPLARPFNVILILVDSLRADQPWNGYERPVAPRLTELAARSVNYPHAYSLSPYTAKSVGGLMGAKYPSEMPRTAKFFTIWPDADNVFLAEVVGDGGHRTLGGHAHGYFHPPLGIEQGFDDWRVLPNIILGVQAGITGDRLTDLAMKMLGDPDNVAQDGGQRFFAYFHFMDPHHTYEKHADFPTYGSNLRDRYDHEVAYVDHHLGRLFDFIEEQPWADRTAIIVSADHGESFGERGHFRHGYEIWESVVHVPLLLVVPGVEPRRIEAFRSHIDLARTILDLMKLDAPKEFRGESLVAEMRGAKAEARPVIVDLPRCNLQDRRRAVIAPDGYKLIAFGDDKDFMLFNVLEDPTEQNELSETKPEVFARMKQQYEELSKKIPLVEVRGNEPLKGAPKGRRW